MSDRELTALKRDAVIDTVDEIRRNIHLESLAECAPLVREADDNALSESRGNDRKREHVLADYIPLYLIEFEILLGIPQSSTGMREAVQPVRRIRFMPVIKEIIMEKSTSYKARLVYLKTGKTSLDGICEEEAELGNGNAMLKHGSRAVLGISLQFLYFRTYNYILTAGKQVFCKLVLGNVLRKI